MFRRHPPPSHRSPLAPTVNATSPHCQPLLPTHPLDAPHPAPPRPRRIPRRRPFRSLKSPRARVPGPPPPPPPARVPSDGPADVSTDASPPNRYRIGGEGAGAGRSGQHGGQVRAGQRGRRRAGRRRARRASPRTRPAPRQSAGVGGAAPRGPPGPSAGRRRTGSGPSPCPALADAHQLAPRHPHLARAQPGEADEARPRRAHHRPRCTSAPWTPNAPPPAPTPRPATRGPAHVGVPQRIAGGQDHVHPGHLARHEEDRPAAAVAADELHAGRARRPVHHVSALARAEHQRRPRGSATTRPGPPAPPPRGRGARRPSHDFDPQGPRHRALRAVVTRPG